MLILFMVLFALAFAHDEHGHNCIHDEMEHHPITLKPISYMKEQLNAQARLDQAYVPYETVEDLLAWQNIRIRLDWSFFPNDPALAWVKTSVVPDAFNFLTKALSVIPIQGKLHLHKRCYKYLTNPWRCVQYYESTLCGYNITIPDYYIAEKNGTGVTDTDFVLFITGHPTATNVLAYASTCQALSTVTNTEEIQGRPTAGYINFGSEYIKESSKDEVQRIRWVKIAIHEIMHALGFSGYQFQNFVDQFGRRRAPETITRNFHERGLNLTKLVTPKVLAVAKEHFGCPDLNGVELESQGGAGTTGSHFDMREYFNDIMKGTSTYPKYEEVTKLTLAVFEDSGWYQPNYEVASPMFWGKNQGCRFALDYCLNLQSGVSNFPRFWCDDLTQKLQCTTGRLTKGVCGIANWTTPLPKQFQYFPNRPSLGGFFQMADFCPVLEDQGLQFGTFKQSATCSDQKNLMNPNYFVESFGPSSRCLSTSLLYIPPDGRYYKPTGVGCYSVQCYRGTYSVLVGNKWVNCPVNSQISVDGYQGTLSCPPFDEVCY